MFVDNNEKLAFRWLGQVCDVLSIVDVADIKRCLMCYFIKDNILHSVKIVDSVIVDVTKHGSIPFIQRYKKFSWRGYD